MPNYLNLLTGSSMIQTTDLKMKNYLLVIALLITCMCLAPHKEAVSYDGGCSLMDMDAAYQRASVVFTGEVKDHTRNLLKYVVHVKDVYKGIVKGDVLLSSQGGSMMYGGILQLRKGESYLIYAYGDMDDLKSSSCHRTKSTA
jgi:hypothetical protein